MVVGGGRQPGASVIELNSEQRQQALNGEVVVQQMEETDVHLMAFFVQASLDVVMKAVDLPPRLDEIENPKALSGMMWAGISPYVGPLIWWSRRSNYRDYECDWEQLYCNYALDPSKENRFPLQRVVSVRGEGEGVGWNTTVTPLLPDGYRPH